MGWKMQRLKELKERKDLRREIKTAENDIQIL